MSVLLPLLGGSLLSGQATKVEPMELLRLNQEAMFALKTFHADAETKWIVSKTKSAWEFGTVTAEKPNKILTRSSEPSPLPYANAKALASKDRTYTYICDGSNLYIDKGRTFEKIHDVRASRIGMLARLCNGFYTKDSSIYARVRYAKAGGSKVQLRYEGAEKVESVLCDKVEVLFGPGKASGGRAEENTYYIGREDRIVRRQIVRDVMSGRPGYARDTIFTNVSSPKIVKGTIFIFKPAKGAAFVPSSN